MNELRECTEPLKRVYAEYVHTKLPSTVDTLRVTYMLTEDHAMWEKMLASKHGEQIEALLNGDTSAYANDDSRADLAFCSYLAYWCNGDRERIDRMFRQSGLMRDKWNNDTYRQLTIDKAIGGLSYATVNVPEEVVQHPLTEAEARDEDINVAEYLDQYFASDVETFRQKSTLRSGFSNLDEAISLVPGVYIIGAEPGAGKTTLCTQLADQLAMAGQSSIYFSLEQSRFELISKGVSRLSTRYYLLKGKIDYSTALTAMQVRTQGRSNQVVARAIGEYKKFAVREMFICDSLNLDGIKQKIVRYIERYQTVPVVIVDYLQIVQSSSYRSSTKEVIDRVIMELKRLQREHNLVMFLISSLNRENYMLPITEANFKETGSIEYTADVIFGLQLKAVSTVDTSLKSKKEGSAEKISRVQKINTAKKQLPRKMELTCLKNRFGGLFSVDFEYNAQFELFVPEVRTDNSVGYV